MSKSQARFTKTGNMSSRMSFAGGGQGQLIQIDCIAYLEWLYNSYTVMMWNDETTVIHRELIYYWRILQARRRVDLQQQMNRLVVDLVCRSVTYHILGSILWNILLDRRKEMRRGERRAFNRLLYRDCSPLSLHLIECWSGSVWSI